MIEMTLSSSHRIRNSSPGGLRPSTLPLGHGGSPQYWLSHVDGEETIFVSFKPPRPGTEPRALAWKAAVLTTTLRPPPSPWGKHWCMPTQTLMYAYPYCAHTLVSLNPHSCISRVKKLVSGTIQTLLCYKHAYLIPRCNKYRYACVLQVK